MKTESELQEQIDLLVDGELPDTQRRSLITSFEDSPERWRQCALTFLESQMLSAGLQATEIRGAERDAKPRRFGLARFSHGAGIAASVGLAFLLGMFAWPHPQSESAQSPEASAPREKSIREQTGSSRARPVFQVSNVEGLPMYSTREALPTFMLEALVRAGHRVQRVQRTVNLPNESGDPIQLPVRELHIVDMRPATL